MDFDALFYIIYDKSESLGTKIDLSLEKRPFIRIALFSYVLIGPEFLFEPLH